MALETIPTFQDLMLPVLRAAESNEVRISSVVEELADKLKLSVEERNDLLPSGKQTVFANRVHWAKSYLGKAGLVELTRRSYFKITDAGRQVLKGNPTDINIKFLEQFKDFRVFREMSKQSQDFNNGVQPSADAKETPDEQFRSAHEIIQAALAEELLQRVRSAPPDFFERLIINLLLAMGYGGSVAEAGRALGKSGDDGIDGVIDQDTLGLDQIYIQAKRYAESNSVSAGAIRDFAGSLDIQKASKGLFVTTSTFSSSAMETVKRLRTRVVFVDGKALAHLMIRYSIGCRIEETLHLKKLDEEFFDPSS